MEEIREQRKNPRFQLQQRTLARISTMPDRLFHIVDICSEGLAFRYLGDNELNELSGELDIVFADHFTLGKLPVEAISDCAIDYGFIPMRRRSLRFADLTPWQKAELELFLMKCMSNELH